MRMSLNIVFNCSTLKIEILHLESADIIGLAVSPSGPFDP